MVEKVKEGNCHANFAADLVRAAARAGVEFWVENPAGSLLWSLPSWSGILKDGAFFEIDFCRCGTRWRERTRFLLLLL